MKRGAKQKPSKKVKEINLDGRLQTISSMFQRASTRLSSVKSESCERQNSCNKEEEDDDCVIMEVGETSSSYFKTKENGDLMSEDVFKKSPLKHTVVSDGSKPRKKSKLWLSRAGDDCKEHNQSPGDKRAENETRSTGVSDESKPRKKSKLSLSRAGDDCKEYNQSPGDKGAESENETCSNEFNSNFCAESKELSLLDYKKSKEYSSHGTPPDRLKANPINDSETNNREGTHLLNLKTDSKWVKTDTKSSELNKDCDKYVDVGLSCGVTSKARDWSDTNSEKNHSNEASEEVFKDNEIEGAASEENQPFTEPYYFNNFETILSTVIQDESNTQLFNEEDMNLINKYNLLSDAAKKMYIRLFGRRLQWIPLTKMNYPEINKYLKPQLDELVSISFAFDETNLTDLRTVLEALSAADVKTLAKVYHVPSNITQKGQQMTELLKQTQRTNISDMFGSGGGRGGLANSMMNRAKKFLSGVYKLSEAPRALFVRIMMLFSVVNTSLDEDSGNGGQGQLFHMLMVNMGKVVYPEFQIDKSHSIFGSRADVLRFSEALQLESDFLHATEKGKWDEAYTVFLTVQEKQRVLEADQDIVSWNKNLPGYLRAFTATSVIYRLLSQGIEVLQRRKDFMGAVDLLKTLLGQEYYCCTHRGYWWERLALNLDAHLKQPEQALEAVLSGLADSHVKVGHRLALYLRGKGICERPHLKLGHRLKECYHTPLKDLPKVHLEGRVLHSSTGAGPRFLTQDSYRREEDGNGMGDLAVCGVEEFVLDHYRAHGFPSGMHAEGSIVSSLFALFCWDILFLPRPDAFHSPYQAMPLDLYTDDFYDRRKPEIDKRIEDLSNKSVENLQAIAEESWISHEGVACTGMSWERMRSADCIKELVACMGPSVLTGILKRFAHNPRHTRSGFPDLTLWNPVTGAFKICEVKGPGDKLSHKQILWLDYLLGLGVDAEVCHVKAVAAKRLMPSS